MINKILREQIVDAYDDIMRDYHSSIEVHAATSAWNKKYYTLRNKLDPDLQQEFDDLIREDEESCEAEQKEALYRGAMVIIAGLEDFLKK